MYQISTLQQTNAQINFQDRSLFLMMHMCIFGGEGIHEFVSS